MRAIVNRKLSFGVLAGTLLAAGCGSNQGTGILVLSISADPQIPDEAASKLVISYPGGASHVYPGKFPPKDRSTLPLKLQIPNLPASDTPVTFTVQGFDASGCAVTKPATTGAVVIKAGAETAPIAVTLAKSDVSCGDGGVPIGSADGGSTAFDGAGNGIDGTPSGVDGTGSTGTEAGVAVSDGSTPDASGIDSTKDSPQPNSTEVGGIPDGSDAINPTRAEVADTPLGSETGSDVPLGNGGAPGNGGISGSGGGSGIGGATSSGGTMASGGLTTSGGATSSGGTTTSGGVTSAGGATTTGGTMTSGGVAITGGATGSGGTTTSAGGVTSTGGVATGGNSGTGGTIAVCQEGTTQCIESDLQTCTSGQWGTGLACASGLVCERNAPAACLDPNWAEWSMPNCQSDATAGVPNLVSYTDNGDGTVTDNITKLMWQQAVPAALYTWAGAKAFCPTLNLAGHNDWRLPSIIELASIVDLGQSYPSINGTYFPATLASVFWSSSPWDSSSSNAWSVIFDYGYSNYDDVLNTNFVRCVR